MNNSKIVIHIGPPKTATTALQYFLQQIEIENFIYGGIIQPRGCFDSSICSNIYSDITNRRYKHKKSIQFEIQKILNENKTLFISEECFLVNGLNAHPSWKQKIKDLYEYVGIFDPILLLSIRNPEKVLISYYIEMYKNLQSNYQKDFRFFFESEFCDIYKYEKLISYLDELNFKQIKIIEFDKMIHGNYFFSDLMICPENSKQNSNLIFQKKNVSIPAKNGKHYAKRKTVNLILLSIARNLNLPVLKKLRGKGFGTKILSNLPDLQLPPKPLGMDFQNFNYDSFVKEYKSVLKNIDKL